MCIYSSRFIDLFLIACLAEIARPKAIEIYSLLSLCFSSYILTPLSIYIYIYIYIYEGHAFERRGFSLLLSGRVVTFDETAAQLGFKVLQ